jgi:hypothetical protein
LPSSIAPPITAAPISKGTMGAGMLFTFYLHYAMK